LKNGRQDSGSGNTDWKLLRVSEAVNTEGARTGWYVFAPHKTAFCPKKN